MPGSKVSKKKVNAKKAVSNACCVWDFTMWDVTCGEYKMRDDLNDICKKYCFQEEQGEETGKSHYQGRFSLKVKKRKPELLKILDEKWGKGNYHVSITSNENKGNNFYVMKIETAIGEPCTDENETFVPRQIRKMKVLRPWQQQLMDVLKPEDDRIVDIVYEPEGCVGKSSFVQYMKIIHGAGMLPFCNDYKDVMRCAYGVGPKDLYLIDIPRSILRDNRKLSQLFSGIETLKSGYCYDERNKWKDRDMDRPRICVFINEIPDMTLLSKDMWKFWTVIDNELVSFDPKKDQEVVDSGSLSNSNDVDVTNLEFLPDIQPEFKVELKKLSILRDKKKTQDV